MFQPFLRLPLSILTNKLAEVLAGVLVSVAGYPLLHELAHRVSKRNIHGFCRSPLCRFHAAIMPTMFKSCQASGGDTNASSLTEPDWVQPQLENHDRVPNGLELSSKFDFLTALDRALRLTPDQQSYFCLLQVARFTERVTLQRKR